MGYQSKTWSLSDDVVEEIGRRVTAMIEATGAGSPNRVLKDLLFPAAGQIGIVRRTEPDAGLLHHDVCGVRLTDADLQAGWCSYCKEPLTPPARELLEELDRDER